MPFDLTGRLFTLESVEIPRFPGHVQPLMSDESAGAGVYEQEAVVGWVLIFFPVWWSGLLQHMHWGLNTEATQAHPDPLAFILGLSPWGMPKSRAGLDSWAWFIA